MTNLLPENVQQKVWSEYRSRYVLTGSLLLILAAALSFLALSPSYIVLATVHPAATAFVSVTQNKSDSVDIIRAQTLVSQFGPVITATSSLSQTISAVLAGRPRGVHIDHLTYTSGNQSGLVIAGTAQSRAEINAYRETLDADARFTSVTLPVGDLVGGQGGRFTLTLSGHF